MPKLTRTPKAGSPPQPHDLEFRRLFWAARREHTALDENATGDTANQRAALDFVHKRGWVWAEPLLEASRLDRAGKHEEALRLLEDSRRSVPSAHRSLVYFIQGAGLNGKGDLVEAIAAYRQALKDPNFDRPGAAWNNLGNALRTKGKLPEAIEAYRKALEVLYDRPGAAWYNLGHALNAIGDVDGAIDAFRKATEDPNYNRQASAWTNLGVVLTTKGELKGAILAFRRALRTPDYAPPAKLWSNLGKAYTLAKKTELAKKAYKKALSLPDPAGFDHRRARLGLAVLEGTLKPKALSADDRLLIERKASEPLPDSPEARIFEKIANAKETQYEKYLQKKDSARDNTLSILRGWSSAVTLLEGSSRSWRGGGYFLKWKGCGIVIDPGLDFLREFHDAGFHGREISAVVVSHNHTDHNSDLKRIDDLRYELYSRLAAKKDSGNKPYVLLWDEDSSGAIKFSAEQPAHQYAPIALPSGYPQSFDLSKDPWGLPVRVLSFKVEHGKEVPHAMGVVLELLEGTKVAARVGYTGDTGFCKSLSDNLKNCDVLIAHISQPDPEELQDATKSKKNHLGYRGVIRLLNACGPKLALIGEFWSGFADLRIDLVKGLRLRSKCKSILPAGLGMHLRLPSLEVECTECGNPTSLENLQVAPPAAEFGPLSYLCAECRLWSTARPRASSFVNI